MSIREIRASFECDECGELFSVAIDPAYRPPTSWSMDDVATDAVRGSVDYTDKQGDKIGFAGCSSVQDDKCLCAKCTEKADADEPDANNGSIGMPAP